MRLDAWLSIFVDLHGAGQARGQARHWRRLPASMRWNRTSI